MPAMVVNDNACELNEGGALESIASKLATAGSQDRVKKPKNRRLDVACFFCGRDAASDQSASQPFSQYRRLSPRST